MTRTNFENLKVYQLAEQLSDQIWTIVEGWKILARDTLGKQMIRSADSIGANIAEGSGRGSFKENRHFVRVARGSLYETRHWLRRAFKRKFLTAEQIQALVPLVENLSPLLNGYLRSLGKRIDNEAKGGTNYTKA